MKRNVATQLLEIIAQQNVKQVFGVTGDALNFFVKAIEEHSGIEWIGMKHEGNAAFAAFGQGEIGAQLGVCAGTTGPGALHLINGLYNAKKERTPVLAITGQVPLDKLGTNYHQEVNLEKMFDDICAYQAIIRSPEQAPRIIQKAIRIAINERAVCRIELPSDIAAMEAEGDEFLQPVEVSTARLTPGKSSVEMAAAALNDAKNVTILAGHGCREAKEAVIALSRKLKAPIVHTFKASDIFHHETENVAGLTGLVGNPSGYSAVMKCDLLLMLATDFPYDEFLPHETTTIQVDTRIENIGNRTAVKIPVHGDVLAFLEQIQSLTKEKQSTDFLEKHTENFLKWRRKMLEEQPVGQHSAQLHPQELTRRVNKIAADNAWFVVETGTSVIWAAHHLSLHAERRMIGSFNHGSMSVGLPAAMGAQFLDLKREVWCLSGDGSFNMNLNDFITAVKYKLPLKLIVFNNFELGFVKIEMEEAGLKPELEALHETNVSFADYAKLCGGDGIRVTHPDELDHALEIAKNSDKPFVIDAVVSSGELSLPSHISLREAWNFGRSKVKEAIQAISGDHAQWENLKSEINSFFD